MKIAFKIPPVTNNFSDMHLLVEAGKENISFLILFKNPFSVEGFYSYNLHPNISPADYAVALKNILEEEEVLKHLFSTVSIFYNFNTASLIPAAYFVEEEKNTVCDVMFGQDKTALCFHENVRGQAIKLLYRVPEKIYESLNNLFPKNIFAHSTSEQVGLSGNDIPLLQCIIYHSSIKVLLFKNDKIQLVQYFDYETPADVCYHLLNVCERFQISTASVNLVLCGMIDKDSGLYTEIYKYFLHVSFSKAVTAVNIGESLQELPPHFYHHLTALAQCV